MSRKGAEAQRFRCNPPLTQWVNRSLSTPSCSLRLCVNFHCRFWVHAVETARRTQEGGGTGNRTGHSDVWVLVLSTGFMGFGLPCPVSEQFGGGMDASLTRLSQLTRIFDYFPALFALEPLNLQEPTRPNPPWTDPPPCRPFFPAIFFSPHAAQMSPNCPASDRQSCGPSFWQNPARPAADGARRPAPVACANSPHPKSQSPAEWLRSSWSESIGEPQFGKTPFDGAGRQSLFTNHQSPLPPTPHHEAQVTGRCHGHPSGCLPVRQAQGPELAKGRQAMSLRSIPRAKMRCQDLVRLTKSCKVFVLATSAKAVSLRR